MSQKLKPPRKAQLFRPKRKRLERLPLDCDGVDITLYGNSIMISFHFGADATSAARAYRMAEKLRRNLGRIRNQYAEAIQKDIKRYGLDEPGE